MVVLLEGSRGPDSGPSGGPAPGHPRSRDQGRPVRPADHLGSRIWTGFKVRRVWMVEEVATGSLGPRFVILGDADDEPSTSSLFKVSITVLRAAQDSVTSVPTDG